MSVWLPLCLACACRALLPSWRPSPLPSGGAALDPHCCLSSRWLSWAIKAVASRLLSSICPESMQRHHQVGEWRGLLSWLPLHLTRLFFLPFASSCDNFLVVSLQRRRLHCCTVRTTSPPSWPRPPPRRQPRCLPLLLLTAGGPATATAWRVAYRHQPAWSPLPPPFHRPARARPPSGPSPPSNGTCCCPSRASGRRHGGKGEGSSSSTTRTKRRTRTQQHHHRG